MPREHGFQDPRRQVSEDADHQELQADPCSPGAPQAIRSQQHHVGASAPRERVPHGEEKALHAQPPASDDVLIDVEGGVLVRAGHTEAAIDVSRLAGLIPSGVICEIMNDDGTMARLPDLVAFAQRHGLKIATIR